MLAMEDSAGAGGAGPAVVLLHGLTATRRYVVMGSKLLEREGLRVVAYDARGHGESDPAQPYDYRSLADDLRGVMDELEIDRAVLAGASMGAHTAVRMALDTPERVAGLVAITPAFLPGERTHFGHWDALSRGMREGGVEGFIDAYGDPHVPDAWKETVVTVMRQRLSQHLHPDAVADALEQIPRSQPFGDEDDLTAIAAPTIVVADRDEVDPGHPLEVGERWARLIPGARLVVEEEGKSPIAWQGGQLSRLILGLAQEVSA